MKRRRRRKIRTRPKLLKSKRVAVHISTHLLEMAIRDAERLMQKSLRDAFLPKIVRVASTPEQADALYETHTHNPYWQSQYSEQSIAAIQEQYGGLLPMICQYQIDSSTLVGCLKVEDRVSFAPVYHFETNNRYGGKDYHYGTINSLGLDASELFFGLCSEKDTPAIKNWDDIGWDDIGVVPKANFEKFVKVLLKRLEASVFEIWKGGRGHAPVSGFDQKILRGTYFDVLKDLLIKEGVYPTKGTGRGDAS